MTKPMTAITLTATSSSGVAVPCAGREDRVEAELARLASLDLAGLQRQWRRVLGRPAPEHLNRPLLHGILAYRAQAAAFGDLDRETARQLNRLARGETDRRGEHHDASGASATDAIPLPSAPASRPGTVLVREWRGELQQVTVLEQGFAWNGTDYDSLSKVARAITGTNWNGPRFFGLRGKATGTESAKVRAVQDQGIAR
ncbi:DUF2924 domain-containing protein [Methylobacterium marchantiae]|uniref:DUF2924 domain-containing protein n=1 Tax=Methylobacterium marchantiae TaxID=600331 RepID=A0ABW3WXN5_9HYPH|nr:hypothetical protein AIGOOFII_2945 [Methylobacterium marchantiae]